MSKLINEAINTLVDDDFRRIILEKYYHPKTNISTYYARLEEQRFNKGSNKTYYSIINKVEIDEFTYKKACEFLKQEEYEKD